MVDLSKLFGKKDLTEKQLKEREYKKKIKVLRKKLFKNPSKVMDFVSESEKLMDDMIKDGLMTEKEKEKQIIKFGKDLDKMQRISSKFKYR